MNKIMDKKSKILKRKQPNKKSREFLSPERQERSSGLKQNILQDLKRENSDLELSPINVLKKGVSDREFQPEQEELSPITNYNTQKDEIILHPHDPAEPEEDEDDDALRQKFEINDDNDVTFDDINLNNLQRLAICCKSLAKFLQKINQYFDEIFENLNLKCKNKNIPSLLFLYLSFLIIMIVFIILTLDSTQLTTPVGYNDAQKYIANNLLGGVLLFTFYGIFFMQFGNKIIFIFLFIFQAVPGLAIFVNILYVQYVTKGSNTVFIFFINPPNPNLNSNQVNQNSLVTSIYFFSIYFFWLFAYLIKNDLKQYITEKTKNIFLILWCIVPGFIIFGYTSYSISINFDLSFEWGYHFLNVIGAPYIIVITLLWAYVHFSFFDPFLKKLQKSQPTTKETHVTDLDEQVELENLSDLTKSVNFTKSLYLGRKKGVSFFKLFFNNYIVLFTSFALGIPMIICSLLCLFYMSSSLTQGASTPITEFDNPQAFYMSMLMVVGVPLYVITGVILIYSEKNAKEKLIGIPILGAMIPVIMTFPLSNVLDNFLEFRPLKNWFALGPCFVSLYWVTLVYLKTNNWRLSMLFNSYVSFFFLLPIFYINPLRGVNMYERLDSDAEIVQYTLIIFGAAIIIIIFVVDLVITVVRNWMLHLKTLNKRKKFGEEVEDEFINGEAFELQQIFKYDLEYFGLWGNSVGCIMTFTILTFMYFQQIPSITQVQKGVFIGLQVTIVYLFLCCILILTLKIAPPQSKEKSFSEQVASIFGKHELQHLRERQEKVRRTILHIGFIESPLILGILILIFFMDKDLEEMACLVSIFGILAVTLFFLIFLQLKIQFEKFGRTTIPALIVFCWLFIYMPFAGIIPASILYLETDWQDTVSQVYYQRIVTGAIALILASGLAISTFIFHLFFKRKDFSQKLKFISNKIIILMAKNHVKSDYAISNLAYEGFLEQGEETVRQTMKEGKDYIYWTQISKFDPNPSYSKMILDHDTYKKYEQKKNNKNPKKDFLFGDLSFFRWVFYICCCYREQNQFSVVVPIDQVLDLGDDDEDTGAFQRAQDEAHADNLIQLKLQEEQDQLNDRPTWIKAQILQVNKLKFDDRILEPLRRYDLPQNLQVHKHLQNQFLNTIFELFAQGSKYKYESPWIDYIMFKQFVILSGMTKFIQDEEIDKIYSKYTKGNENPILEDRFPGILTQIAVGYYNYDLPEEALGKLIKNWLFPYLLWYIIPLHGFYPNEWDYVLFLLKHNEMHDSYEAISRLDIDFRKKLEKHLGISSLDQQELNPDLEGNMEEERFTFKKFLKLIKEYCVKNSENYVFFIKSFCYLENDLKNDVIEAQSRRIKDTILKVKYEVTKKKKVYKHDESPGWSFIVDQIVDEIMLGEREWQEMRDKNKGDITFRHNTINFIVIISKIIEIYTLGSLAFRPQIPWGINQSGLYVLNLFNTEIQNASFQYMFAIGIIFIISYLIVSYKSIIRIKNKVYGESESQKIKQFYSLDFLYISFIHIIHHVFGFFMIKIVVDALACDYAVVPIELFQDKYIKCFQVEHRTYFGLSIVGVIMIYPLLTFLFSNIQYHNRSLDIKYDPTYISLQGNIRFLIAVSSSFFAKEENVIISTIFSATMLILLGILAKKMKPCFIKKINPLEMGGYFFSGWLHVSAAITIWTNPLGGSITLLVGTIFIIFISLAYFKILHDKSNEKDRKRLLVKGGDEMEQMADEDCDESKISEDEEVDIKQDIEGSLEFRIWKGLNEFKQRKELLGEWPEEAYQFADLMKKQIQYYDDDNKDDFRLQNSFKNDLSNTFKNDISQDHMINRKKFNEII